MSEGYWVVRTYEAGIIGEKTKFWIPGSRPNGKDKRKEKSEIRKQESNEYSAVKQFARLMHANFQEGDLLLGLDYSPAGRDKLQAAARRTDPAYDRATEEEQRNMIFDAAAHEMELCVRRVQRELKKQGIELKYMGVTSDMDGETKEVKPVHHHLVVPKGVAEVFEQKWSKLGGVSWKPISKQADYTPIAEYYLKQVRRVPNANKYCTSRNLVRPQPKDRVVQSDAELRVPKGGKLLFRQEYKTNTDEKGERWIRPQYIRYIIPSEKRKKGEAA